MSSRFLSSGFDGIPQAHRFGNAINFGGSTLHTIVDFTSFFAISLLVAGSKSKDGVETSSRVLDWLCNWSSRASCLVPKKGVQGLVVD